MKYKFLLNPFAGRKKKGKALVDLIEHRMKQSSLIYEFAFTKGEGDATRLASEAVKDGFDIIVAVGGDGTVNEVASGLIGTKGILGILPVGSGNGVARSLKIPLDVEKNLLLLQSAPVFTIDVGKINNKYFIGVAGTGFDALIGTRFQEFGVRGPLPYFLIGIREFLAYHPLEYILRFDDSEIMRTKAVVIVCANTREYGNGAIIAPAADPSDGFLDICIIKPLSIPQGTSMAVLLFQGKLDKSTHYIKRNCKSLNITSESGLMYWHRDGEPNDRVNTLDIHIEQKALQVCSPLAEN